MPYLNVLSKFRDDIRTEARLNKRIIISTSNFYNKLVNYIIILIYRNTNIAAM